LVIEIKHRYLEVNGLRMRVAEAGTGPLVLLLHGFPECWYSWRHQLRALAEAGFRGVAPNQRGYPGTDSPRDIADYTMLHLVGDVIGLISALGEQSATVIGHDWGAPVAWHTALLRPDKVRGVAGLSVPPSRRSDTPPLSALRARYGPDYYQLHFQQAGVEAEFEADLDKSFRRPLYGMSGDHPEINKLQVPEGSGFLDIWSDPVQLPDWLTETDVQTYVSTFIDSGFTGPLNWYRNIDRNWALTAAWHGAPIAPPAMVLVGNRDPVVAAFDLDQLARSVHRFVPNLRGFEVIPGAGHWIQQERPEVVNATLIDFAAATAP
jgi:pimeloyl-ACP methyl ester carboxylesterase